MATRAMPPEMMSIAFIAATPTADASFEPRCALPARKFPPDALMPVPSSINE